MPRRSVAVQLSRSPSPQRRAFVIGVALVLWMLVISGRLIQLQISQHEYLSARARSQQLGTIETNPSRGQLLDRQGRELARSIDTESFFADPNEIENVDAV